MSWPPWRRTPRSRSTRTQAGHHSPGGPAPGRGSRVIVGELPPDVVVGQKTQCRQESRRKKPGRSRSPCKVEESKKSSDHARLESLEKKLEKLLDEVASLKKHEKKDKVSIRAMLAWSRGRRMACLFVISKRLRDFRSAWWPGWRPRIRPGRRGCARAGWPDDGPGEGCGSGRAAQPC